MICNKCGKCCRRMRFKLADEDHATWVAYHGVEVLHDKRSGDLFAVFYVPCQKLVDNECSIYEERPDLCKRFFCEEANDNRS